MGSAPVSHQQHIVMPQAFRRWAISTSKIHSPNLRLTPSFYFQTVALLMLLSGLMRLCSGACSAVPCSSARTPLVLLAKELVLLAKEQALLAKELALPARVIIKKNFLYITLFI